MSNLKLRFNSTSIIYIDSSAYLCLLLGEKSSSHIENALANCAICSSSLLVLETERNLVRLSRERLISERDFFKLRVRFEKDLDAFILKDLTLDLCRNGSFPAIKTPRSSDLAHLRTALWFLQTEKLDGFLTVDRHQLESAMELNLPILEI